jgi:hypothetical protein
LDENEWLAERFEEHRAHLRAIAYRMLGSLTEADDAVQDTWLRVSRSGTGGVEDLQPRFPVQRTHGHPSGLVRHQDQLPASP